MSAARLLSLLALTATAACAAASPKASTRERAASGELAELAYAEAGDGRPVVFVHGAYGDLRTFARAIPILSAGQRLIVPSLRYHWPNPWPASDEEAYRSYTVETHARDVVALIERLGVAERPHRRPLQRPSGRRDSLHLRRRAPHPLPPPPRSR